jgi:hypothetical protein
VYEHLSDVYEAIDQKMLGFIQNFALPSFSASAEYKWPDESVKELSQEYQLLDLRLCVILNRLCSTPGLGNYMQKETEMGLNAQLLYDIEDDMLKNGFTQIEIDGIKEQVDGELQQRLQNRSPEQTIDEFEIQQVSEAVGLFLSQTVLMNLGDYKKKLEGKMQDKQLELQSAVEQQRSDKHKPLVTMYNKVTRTSSSDVFSKSDSAEMHKIKEAISATGDDVKRVLDNSHYRDEVQDILTDYADAGKREEHSHKVRNRGA